MVGNLLMVGVGQCVTHVLLFHYIYLFQGYKLAKESDSDKNLMARRRKVLQRADYDTDSRDSESEFSDSEGEFSDSEGEFSDSEGEFSDSH